MDDSLASLLGNCFGGRPHRFVFEMYSLHGALAWLHCSACFYARIVRTCQIDEYLWDSVIADFESNLLALVEITHR